MTTVTLGPIRRLLLLGGGDLLLRLAETGRRRGLAVDVITSPDQAKELHEEGIEFHPLPVLPDERN